MKPLILLAAALLLPGCATVPTDSGADALRGSEDIVIARVNDRSLTLEEAMQAFLPSHTGHGVLVRGEPALRELAARLVERDLFLAEAYTLGIHEDPAVLEAVEDYGRALAEIEYWKRAVDDRVEVSEDEVEAFYAKTDVALSLTVIRVDDRETAEELRARVVAGEDMEELASAHSNHSTASFGGRLAYVRRGEVAPELEDDVFSLTEPGALTPVVRTEGGFAFVRLDERSTNPIQAPREVAIPQIRNVLEGRASDRLREEAEARLDERAGIRIVEDRLSQETLLADSDVDVVVGESCGETLTLGELREMLDLEAIAQAPAEEIDEVAVAIVRLWARREALDVEAAELGLLEDPELAGKLDQFRRDAILKTLYRDYVYADLTLEEADVRAYYEEHADTKFTRPAEVRMAYIVVQEEDEAVRVLERLRAGEEFSVVASEASIDQASAAHGGRIGWIRPGQILPAVEEQAFALAPGELAGPVETELGWFVVQALDRREPVPLPFEIVRRTAEERLVKDRQKEAYARWARALRERADIEILDEGIRRAAAWIEEQDPAAAEAEPASPPAGGGAHG